MAADAFAGVFTQGNNIGCSKDLQSYQLFDLIWLSRFGQTGRANLTKKSKTSKSSEFMF
jgi:hypothetical protein